MTRTKRQTSVFVSEKICWRSAPASLAGALSSTRSLTFHTVAVSASICFCSCATVVFAAIVLCCSATFRCSLDFAAQVKNPPFPAVFQDEAVRHAKTNRICVTYQLWIALFTMLYRTVISSFLVAAAFAFAPSTPAQASGIEGKVLGVDGRPLQGAEVRIERNDKTGSPVTIQTNRKGSYGT